MRFIAQSVLVTLENVGDGFGHQRLFDNINLSIHGAQRLCLVGRNGSGKSSLLKVIAGLRVPQTGKVRCTRGKHIGYLDQNPDLDNFKTLGDFARSELDDTLAYHAQIYAQGLKLDLDIACDKASGGERRRAALVKIIAESPDLLLLDEPTNHLDIEAILWLENALRQIARSFVLITHDRAFATRLSNGLIWLDRGQCRIHPKGFNDFERWRDESYAIEDAQRHKLKRHIKEEARWAIEGISARRKRNQGRLRRLQSLRAQQGAQIKRAGTAALDFSTDVYSGKLVIEARQLGHAFGEKKIVDGLDLKITRGDRVALVGSNGVGKTSVLKLLLGQLEPDFGRIKHGTNLHPVVFDQNRDGLNEDDSLWAAMCDDKDLGISGKNDQIMVRGQARHVVGYLKEFLFDEAQIRGSVRVLSGGERARLLLAKLMARHSNLLILDEPTNDLDVETLDLLQEVLDGYDGSVILVSHDRDFLDRVATKTLFFEGQGRIIAYAGGWSDMQSQRAAQSHEPIKKKPKPTTKPQKPTHDRPTAGLSYTQQYRLGELPKIMERLSAEIERLEVFLSQDDLFNREPVKFQKASQGLLERQTALNAAEEEWLELASREQESADSR